MLTTLSRTSLEGLTIAHFNSQGSSDEAHGRHQGSPTAPLSQLLDPREGDQSTTDAAGNTTIFHRDGSFSHRGADGQVFVSHGDTFFRHDNDGIWSVTRISGEQRAWSERDRTWINFNAAMDVSWWDYDPEKQIWNERASPHPTRPQGTWFDADRNAQVTEISGNLFAESDKGYSVHYRVNLRLKEGSSRTPGFLRAVSSSRGVRFVSRNLEDELRSPVLRERLEATNTSLYALGRVMQFLVGVLDESSGFIPVAGKLKDAIEAIQAVREMSQTAERTSDQQKDVMSFVTGAMVDGVKLANERGTANSALNRQTQPIEQR